MQTSSSIRRKAPFVPWFAALVLGASAHAGWLVHELRSEAHHREPSTSMVVHVDARPAAPDRAVDRRPHPPARTRPPVSPRCRHAEPEPSAAEHARFDLDIWVQQIDRYAYTIDRRALAQVVVGPVEADLERLGIAKALAEVRVMAISGGSERQPIELRNIHAGTPLWRLGLRTGDRLLAFATRGEHELEHVEVAIERRGRPVALSYELI
jgi:hypothetical protein